MVGYSKGLLLLGVLLNIINPGQVPLPEPYFDLTPIRITHTKINYSIFRAQLLYSTMIDQTYCINSFQRLTSG